VALFPARTKMRQKRRKIAYGHSTIPNVLCESEGFGIELFWAGRREQRVCDTLLTNMIAHRQDMVSSTRTGVASSCCAVLISAATAASSPARLEKMFSQHNFSQGTRNGRIFFAAGACLVKRSCTQGGVKKRDQRSHALKTSPAASATRSSWCCERRNATRHCTQKRHERNTWESLPAVLDLFEP
jgi:hypothetical protein